MSRYTNTMSADFIFPKVLLESEANFCATSLAFVGTTMAAATFISRPLFIQAKISGMEAQ